MNTKSLCIDLARAKSDALVDIFSLLKQNIKSCNAKRRRQQKQPKKSVGLISKITTLHVQYTFYVHFFAVVLRGCLKCFTPAYMKGWTYVRTIYQ